MSENKEKKVILVTGGSGLLGSAIQTVIKEDRDLYQPDETWIFVSLEQGDGDLSDYQATVGIFKKYKPTHVIHVAAMVGGLFHNMRQNLEFFRVNMAINDNVLRCAHEMGVKKVIYYLSDHPGPPHQSNFGYAYAKRMIDVLNRAYHQQYGCLFTSAAPCNIFGPHDNFHLENSHVIPGLIYKCYLAKKKKEPLVIRGTGVPLRQFIYSLDLGRLFVWAVRNYEEVEPIIFAVDEKDEITIADAVKCVVEAMQFDGEVVYDMGNGGGPFGGIYGDCDPVAPIVEHAIRNGVNYIDTSYWYGQGRSEERIGKIHDLEFASDQALIVNETLPALAKVRDTGKARYIGISGYPLPVLMSALKNSPLEIDVILTYARGTLIDSTLAEFLPELKQRKIGVINACATAMGLLTPQGPPHWHPAKLHIREACEKAKSYCQEHNVSISKLAMHYSLNFPGVDTTLCGCNRLEFLQKNLDCSWEHLTDKEQICLDFLRNKYLSPLNNENWEGIEVRRHNEKVKCAVQL